jgi:hypothetical protein
MTELTETQIMDVLEQIAQSDFRIRVLDSEMNRGYFLIYGISYTQSTTEILETEMHSPAMVLTTSRREEFDQRVNLYDKSNMYINFFFTTEKFLEQAKRDKCSAYAIHSQKFHELLEKYR